MSDQLNDFGSAIVSEEDGDEMSDKNMTPISRHYFGDESLGAGTSLPGLVAAKVGSNVILTDDFDRAEVLENMKRVCELNKLKFMYCLCLEKAFDDLFATITYLFQDSPGSVFITTYHNRSGHHLIEFLMVKWGLRCVKLIDVFSFFPPYKATELSGNIQLAEIVLSSEPAKGTSTSKVRR